MQDRAYWLGFSFFSGVGPTRFTKLLSHFYTAQTAWNASEKELGGVLGPTIAAAFCSFRTSFLPAAYEEQLQKNNVAFVLLHDTSYPPLLKQSKNAPFVLYYKGALSCLGDMPIGVVGTRKITEYGHHVTQLVTRELVAAGCCIVSGLALGVDSVAHATTLEAKGKTVAVLGCGVDCCTPREHQGLYNSILANGGAIVSEAPLGTAPFKGSFPSRNRIIAGLSLGIVVTEGAVDSGALITAKDAAANNRKVFAVPGPVTSTLSQGPYQLIKNGAIVVGSGAEVLEGLSISATKKGNNNKKIKGDTKEEQQIINLLQQEQLHFDELVKRTAIDPSQLGTILSLLEMKGVITSLSSGMFGLA